MAFDREEIVGLYVRMIAGWNDADAAVMTQDFAANGHIVGFDGTQKNGRAAIAAHMASIFANHRVASYVPIVREIRQLGPDVALLRAVVGMVPPGQDSINPATNAVQTVIAVCHDRRWRIEMFQNTPAAWHGRQSDVDALTAELQAVYDASKPKE
jgi:uncharacterized protein (TIGR02246 family)